MKKLILSTVVFSMMAVVANAQHDHKCGINEALHFVYEHEPTLKEEAEMRALLKNSKVEPVTSNGEAKSDSILYVIPVVFHVLHQYGSENISDQKIFDEIDLLNTNYQKLANYAMIVSEFDTVIGDAQIEFRLAALDPFGNCTNGIEHIYSHETLLGDAYSKLHQWDRSHYLNIWVCQNLNGMPTTLAYAHFPEDTDGMSFWIDGIMSKYFEVGNGPTITHEIGHWMSLAHTWGSTNEPEVACGDDGVDDTPETRGHWTCDVDDSTCNDGIIENVQNYMEYSGCQLMFTEGQVERMHNALIGISGQRNIIWQDSTLAATGVNLTTPLCTPVADFHADNNTVCIGTPIQFSDDSWNATIDNWEWTFQDATPATSTSQNVSVTFNSYGWKKVTLKVTNATGSDTKSVDSYIYVVPDWPEFIGPASLNLEGGEAGLFLINNPEDNFAKFTLTDGVGYDGSRAFKLNNYKDVSDADPFTNDYFYYSRLGSSVDELITPAFDLANTTSIMVTFKYSYATNALTTDAIEEVLKIYSTRNCGDSWTPRLTLSGANVVTAGYASNSDFAPTNNNQWEEASFSYTSTALDYKTRFKFEFTASDVSSNLYIDNINVTGTLGLVSEDISNLELVVYPNPVGKDKGINVSFVAQNEPVEFILRDIQGKVIANQVISTTNAVVETELENTQNLPASCYFLEVRKGGSSMTQKVVVL